VDQATPTLLRSGIVLAVASAGGNVAAFALTIALGRLLGPGDFGAVGALFGLAIVGQVPGLALQAVVARHVATGRHGATGRRTAAPGPHDTATRTLLIVGAAGAAVVAAAGLLLALPLTAALHLDSPAPTFALALVLAPGTVGFAAQGVLQGAERFGALGALILVTSVARVAGGLAGSPAGPAGVLAGMTVGGLVTVAFALYLLRNDLHHRGPRTGVPAGLAGEWWHATAGLGALLALTNADVVLARHYLPAAESGLYAAGAVVAKIAFWLPQAVALVVFPRLTDPVARGPVLARAVAAVGTLGAATSLGAAVLGPWALGVVLGPTYRAFGPELGLFAAAGATGALVQLLLYSGIASGSRAIGLLLLGALAGLVTVVATVAHDSVAAVVTALISVLAAVAVVALVLTRRGPRASVPA
jgi:O-antigen/teichoic acid export membrane protein